MSIEVEQDSCPYCSTKLQYCYINLTEKMLICTKKKCLFPFDVDDISPYIMKVDPDNMVGDNIAGSSSSSPSSNLLDDELTQFESTLTTLTTSTTSTTKSLTTESLPSNLLGSSRAKSNGISTQSKRKFSNLSNSESSSNVPELSKNVSTNSKSFAELSTQSLNPLNEIASNFSMSTSNSNDTITLKTLGITLKVDSTNKKKSRTESSRINGLSINSDGNKSNSSTSASDTIDMNFTQLFSMNNFPISTAEGSSSINAIIGNGLLDANAADANATDTNVMDINATDANVMDVNATVANAMDANATVANAMDINATDTNVMDANATDANVMDINVTDANAMDANATNAISMNANAMDANAIDVNVMNASATDANAMDANTTDANVMDSNTTNNNATNESGSKDILTVEEYSKMLFGQSDIDINLDNLLSNPNMMDLNTQDNDAMDIDELLATYNSMESIVSKQNKTSGNDMDLDLESLVANLNGNNFAEAGIPNGMSGNHLDMDIDSILASTNENILDLINSQNDIVNGQNGHFDIYSEMINGNNGTLENVNGKNGYSHENVEKTKNGVVEEEGKEVKGKTTNEDSVKLTEGKKDG